MVNNLQKIGKRIDNLKKVILKENPKDLWIIKQIHPLFLQLIDSNISLKQEQHLISLLDKVLDKYSFRFRSTFEHKSLTSYLIKGLLFEEEGKKTIGVFGGGFKPPTKGHFEVLKKALDENPEIDEMLVFVGKKERDGITQEKSLKIWEIYGKYLPFKVRYIKSTKPPIQLIYNTAKENPESEVLWIIGAREENEDDFKDISSRTKGITKYPNLELRTIVTKGGVSGTAARNAAKVSKEKLDDFLPEFLSEKEKQDIFVMLSNTVTENEPEDGKASPYGSGYNPIKENTPNVFQNFFSKEIQHWVNEDIKDYGNILEYKIDLNNTYEYSNNDNLWEFYDDVNQVNIIVKLKPTSQGVFEFKFYSLQDGNQLSFSKLKHYNPKVINTVFKIFIDDVLPNNNKILIQPIDYTRYRLFRSLINTNLSPQNYNIQVKDNIESPIIYIEKKTIKENASYSQHIDIWDKIDQLNTHMINKGMNIEPLPTVELINGDTENAKEFLGKTAYYDPNQKHIVLYTEGRHPKDIVRSYAHEMIHHIQNLEDRLGNITTTNTHEDGELNKIEAEANLKGTMTFRNWTDSLNEAIVGEKIECDNCDWSWNIVDGGDDLFVCHKCWHDNTPINEKKTKDPFGLNAYAMELGRLREDETEYQIYCDLDGVLADFERGYEELTGIDLQGEFKPEGEEFWDPISKAGVGFWAGLKWMSDGQQLWDYIKPHKPQLLSAPSREKSSRIGKAVWVKHKIPGTKLILRYASQKKELASPTSILIDDRIKNIEDWESAGGIGILHTSAADTISQLKKLGL